MDDTIPVITILGYRLSGLAHLGDAAYKRLILTHHKDLNRGDYLIDDSVKNGVAEFRGTHIHFGSPEFPNWKAVTEFFKSFIDEKA